MGLDLHVARRNGDDWEYDYDYYPSWSYSGFDVFRQRLAEAEGFNLNDMVGFGTDPYGLGGDEVRGTRSWDTVSTDLEPLLNHSDCDGELAPEQCARVLPRLQAILASWPERDKYGRPDYDVRAGAELCRALERCANDGYVLLFR